MKALPGENYQQWRAYVLTGQVVAQQARTQSLRKSIDSGDQARQSIRSGQRTAASRQQAAVQKAAEARNAGAKDYVPAVSDQHDKAHVRQVQQQVRPKQQPQKAQQRTPKGPEQGR